MKTRTLLAAILIVAGIAALVYRGITYTTTEQAIDFRSTQVTSERTHTIPLPPFVGGITLLGGILMLAAGGKYV